MDGLFDFEYDIGAFLREERKEQGVTLKEISEKIGLSIQAISQYELGKRPIKYSVLEKIVNIFGMSIPAFLYKYDLYDEYIPPHFEGDVDAYEDFKKAVSDDVLNEQKKFNKAAHLFGGYGFEIRSYTDGHYEKIKIIEIESATTVSTMFESEFLNLYDTVVDEIEKFTAYQLSKFLTSQHGEILRYPKRQKTRKEGE